MNLAGFVTYYVYPAAPPWYVAQYGLGPANFAVQASPAAAIRWDDLVGVHYFASFYGRSADVFGAIPSLHVAQPLLVFLFARRLRSPMVSWTSGLYALLVAFSAIYLQHHYLLDVLIGAAYAVVAYWVAYVAASRLESADGHAPHSGARARVRRLSAADEILRGPDAERASSPGR
jgi:membrane-associated phospholipid phosphatase